MSSSNLLKAEGPCSEIKVMSEPDSGGNTQFIKEENTAEVVVKSEGSDDSCPQSVEVDEKFKTVGTQCSGSNEESIVVLKTCWSENEEEAESKKTENEELQNDPQLFQRFSLLPVNLSRGLSIISYPLKEGNKGPSHNFFLNHLLNYKMSSSNLLKEEGLCSEIKVMSEPDSGGNTQFIKEENTAEVVVKSEGSDDSWPQSEEVDEKFKTVGTQCSGSNEESIVVLKTCWSENEEEAESKKTENEELQNDPQLFPPDSGGNTQFIKEENTAEVVVKSELSDDSWPQSEEVDEKFKTVGTQCSGSNEESIVVLKTCWSENEEEAESKKTENEELQNDPQLFQRFSLLPVNLSRGLSIISYPLKEGNKGPSHNFFLNHLLNYKMSSSNLLKEEGPCSEIKVMSEPDSGGNTQFIKEENTAEVVVKSELSDDSWPQSEEVDEKFKTVGTQYSGSNEESIVVLKTCWSENEEEAESKKTENEELQNDPQGDPKNNAISPPIESCPKKIEVPRKGKSHLSLLDLKQAQKHSRGKPLSRAEDEREENETLHSTSGTSPSGRPARQSATRFKKMIEEGLLSSVVDSSDEEDDKPKAKRRRTTSTASSRRRLNSDSDRSSICEDAMEYRERRDRNNLSSKRSRQKRKMHYWMKQKELKELEDKNARLRLKADRLESVLTRVKAA